MDIDASIDDFLAAVLLEQGLSPNTGDAYGSDLRFFAAFLKRRGRNAVEAVSREDIVDFLKDEREDGLASATRARRTVAIRMWLRYLKDRHLIRKNPSELMDPPKKERVLPRVLSEEEVTALIESAKELDPRTLRDRAMLEVLYGCGLRVSELCAFRLNDVVSDGELVRVLGKGSKERLVPMGGAAGRALTAYLASARDSFAHGNLAETHVFLTRLGKPFTRQGVFKVIRERAVAVGISADRISPHVLRHSFASHMLSHGADIRVIQELLGHADIGTTQIYTHVDTSNFSALHRKYHPRG